MTNPRPRGHTRMLAAALVVAGATACSGSSPVADPVADASPTATSSTTPTPAPSDSGPTLRLADELDPDDVGPHDAGFAWSYDGGVLLTTTRGASLGHLPGWSMDREASDRLALPVLVGPDGAGRALTLDGLVALDGPLPLAGGATMLIGDHAVEVAVADGSVVATLEAPDTSDVWVSATGTVVGVIGGDAWDLERDGLATGGPIELDPGCRLADRHDPDAPILVCDDGARLGGATDVPAPEGGAWGWVTVGNTGNEFIATWRSPTTSQVHLGRRVEGTTEVVAEPGAAIFYRGSGNAWVATLGQDGGLGELAPEATVEGLKDLPGVLDVAPFLR